MRVPHVQRVKRANGRVDLYFRKGSVRRGPLKSPDNTPELQTEVSRILEGLKRAAAAAVPVAGTVGRALERYNRSSEFLGLAQSTQRNYQYMIDELVTDCGDLRLQDVDYTWLKDLQDVWASRGYKVANDLMQVLKNALEPARKKGAIRGRPFDDVAKLKRPSGMGEAHPAWRESEIIGAVELAIERKQPGLARAVALGAWGGFRRGGICRIPLAARIEGFDEDGVTEKRLYWTTPKRQVLCDKPEDPRLSAVLARTANRALTIAYNMYEQPWKERALNQAFDRLLERLAVQGRARPELDIHGLRHARGMELAHAGASEFQIMAQLEHATSAAARHYIRQASRTQGANAGQAKVEILRQRRAKRSASA